LWFFNTSWSSLLYLLHDICASVSGVYIFLSTLFSDTT
jgi:hypothetical protein